MDNREKLSIWLKEGGRKQVWFADQVGVTKGTVTNWLAGRHVPEQGYCDRIEEITAGAVKAEDWGND